MRNLFGNLTISRKIGVVFLVLLATMGIGGSVGLYNANRVAQVARFLYEDNFRKTETLSAVETEFLTQRQELFLHIVVADDGTMSLLEGSIGDHTGKINALMHEYRSLGIQEGHEETYKELDRSFSSYLSVQKTVIELSKAGEKDNAMTLIRGEGNRSFNHTLDTLKDLLEKERGSAFVAFQRTNFLARVVILVTLAFVIGAIIVASGLWFATTRSIVRPILYIWEAVKKMEEGDLKQRAPVTTNDEIGTLATEVNRMAENIENYYDTMKKRHEIEKEALARASEMKSQFLANVSHELRTPLNSIIGFSELLKEKSFGKLNDKQAQYVEYINSSGSHLLGLINSILDLSKIEAGRMELVIEEFPITEVLEETMATIRPLAEKRDITLKSKEAPEYPIIRADKGKFKQIMLNLLSNAVKFNVEKGQVTVDWDITEEPHGNAVERFLVMSVTDTGMGVREEDVEKLFKEFEQLEPATIKEHGGTGLGLALTKKLVNMHGGHIWVESEMGKGCTFTVKIPQGAEKTEGMAARAPLVTEGYQETNPSVLVCGESRDINHLLEIYLSTENYDVIKAGDGEELLRKAGQQKPFAIIMGITIPRKDGWEVLKELKGDPETADIPAVIISSANNKELGFALGAVDYLVKPVNKDMLIGSLHRLSFTTKEKRESTKILVVDDEPRVLALLTDILENEGFTVIKAPGGEEAIKAAVEKNPDLMILDLMMPGVSGFDVVDRLKEHPTARNIPVIIFTAKEISEQDKRRLGTNIEKIIQKAGFKKEDLVEEIKRLEWAYPEKANLVDRTTNLFNRRYFDIVLSREVSNSERSGHPFSVLLVDIDNFQKFNEENDFATGDNALVEVAGLIKGDLRKADCVTRYGGDAFAVVLSGIAKEEARLVARKLRALVEAHPITTLDGRGVLTVSIALTCPPEDGTTGIAVGLERTVKELSAEGGNRVSAVKGHGREGG